MAENGKAKVQGEEDRLAQCVILKEIEVEIDGRTIRVIKWGLRQSLRLSARLVRIAGDAIRKLDLPIPEKGKPVPDVKLKLASLLQTDFATLMDAHIDDVVAILTETVQKGNFETMQEASAWVEELGAGDALQIFVAIAKQNIRPLVKAVVEVAKSVGVDIAARKASQRST